jgi:phosphoglucomutase
VGALLAAWAWDNFRRLHPDIPPEKCAVVNSTVSSKFLSALATREGLRYAETLTGFKWIGNVGYNFIQQGCHYVFGFEESIGKSQAKRLAGFALRFSLFFSFF